MMSRVDRIVPTKRGITLVEMQAFLANTCYGPYTQWMLRNRHENWRRFEVSGDGRLQMNELKESIMHFLTTDGFGRELSASSVKISLTLLNMQLQLLRTL